MITNLRSRAAHRRWIEMARIARRYGNRRMAAFFLNNAAQCRRYGVYVP